MTPTRWAVLAAVGLFVVFLLLKSRVALAGSDPAVAKAREKIQAAKKRAREAREPAGKAAAWRDASSVALDELERPGLAASYARRANRADPDDARNLRMLIDTMRRAGRYKSLEKLLWKRLDAAPLEDERAERLFGELLALYEGPMRRPEKARVLRALWSRERDAYASA